MLAQARLRVETPQSVVSGQIATSSGPLMIGGNNVWQEPFAGQIDDLRVYDHALSASQIADDMQRPVG